MRVEEEEDKLNEIKANEEIIKMSKKRRFLDVSHEILDEFLGIMRRV